MVATLDEQNRMKWNRKHKVVIGVVILLYAITWVFGHTPVHEYIDVAEGHCGELKTRSFPVLPCLLFCSSNNMASLGGRWAIGLYVWYGFGVKKVIEIPMVLA